MPRIMKEESKRTQSDEGVTRRSLLRLGGAALAGAAVAPHLVSGPVRAQTPKRGGTINVRVWDPPHLDPYLHDLVQDPHRVLVHAQPARQAQGRPRRGPGHVSDRGRPGRVVEPAERDDVCLQAPSRRAVAAKPPVNGRELTAEDVVYSFERFRTVKGNANASCCPWTRWRRSTSTPCVHAEGALRLVPRHARQPDGRAIVASECVEKFGDLRGPRRPSAPGPGCSIRIGPMSA